MLHRHEFTISRCCCGRIVCGILWGPQPRGGNFVDRREIQEPRAAHVSGRCEIEDGTLHCVRPIKVKGLCPATSDRISYRSCAKLPRKSLARFPKLFFLIDRPKKTKKNEQHDGTRRYIENIFDSNVKIIYSKRTALEATAGWRNGVRILADMFIYNFAA